MLLKNNYTNSNPLVFHANGAHGHEFILNSNDFTGFDKNFTDLVIESHRIVKPNNLTILTYATDNLVDSSPLIRQLNHWGVNFVNLCDIYKGEWDNICKIEYLHDYLKGDNVTTDYVTVLDSIDILLSQDFNCIVDRFLKHNLNIMYGATVSNYPPNVMVNNELVFNSGYEFEKKSKGMFRFLNSGTVIGNTDNLTHFIGLCVKSINREINYLKSDQQEIRINFEKYHVELKLGHDYSSDLFLTCGKFLSPNDGLFKLTNKNGDLLFEIGKSGKKIMI